MNAVLPFEAFLDLLRSKGYGVSLHEYFALASLLERWDRTNAGEFGDALAALVGRSEEEIQWIRRLFAEIYLSEPAVAVPAPLPSPRPTPVLRRWPWALAAAAAVLIAAVALLTSSRWYPRPQPATSAATSSTAPAPAPAPSPLAPIELPPPAPPEVPAAPSRTVRVVVVAAVGTVFLAALSIFWARKTREMAARWARDAWAAALAALPGPFHFDLVLREGAARLPRADVEDAATILGRAFTPDAQARELDVARSLRQTLQRGLLPALVFKPRRTVRTILVFQDICQDMDIWRAKIDTFLADLRRQGVALERWYFDGDVRSAADAPFRSTVRFETIVRRRPGSPILVITSGSLLEPTLATGDREWLTTIREAPRRSWLTPVADVRLWPEAFARLPIDVWPMTRDGLARAARELAGTAGEAGDQLKARVQAEGRVSQDDVERIKRLASVVPHPTPELLDALRRRLAPDVSDAVLVHVLAESSGNTPAVIRLTDEEVRRCLAALRLETPHLEAAARQTVIEVLQDSEPAPGSAAHERWQLSLALQQLQLADVSGREAGAAIASLQALGQGPLWEEVRSAARRLPPNPALAARLGQAIGVTRGKEAAMPDPEAVAAAPRPWAWPGLRELVPAAVAAAIVLVAGLRLNAFPARAVPHVMNAYRVIYQTRGQGRAGALGIERLDPTAPLAVDVVQNTELFKAGVALDPQGGTTTIPLEPVYTGYYYQAGARLPLGNLALSNAQWVPSARGLIVLIDALPWANVTVRGAQTTAGPQPTPLTAALDPGPYRLHFENGGVTPPMDQEIVVNQENRTFRFTMPGFNANQTATQLATPAPAR